MDTRIKKMSISAIIFIILISMINVLKVDLFAANTVKNILIINSYHPSLSWTEAVSDSMIEVFEQYPGEFYTYVEHMDWKNHPTLENLEAFHDSVSLKYKNIKIDMIIATDDAALKFVVINRKELFSNAPIIFTGVDEENAKKIIEDEKKVTGILEEADIENTLGLMKALYPNLENIYTVYDETESGLSMGQAAMKAIKTFDEKINVIECKERTIDDITRRIDRLPENSAVLITVYYNDSEKSILGFNANTKHMIDHTRSIPVFVLYEFNMGSGAVGGSLVSGEAIGQEAAKTAINYLRNPQSHSEGFITLESSHSKVVDYKVLNQLGLNPKNIPEGFHFINKPVTIMETYGNLVYTSVGIFILLVIFIFSLVYYIKKLTLLQKTLQQKNEEQKGLYDELAASEEELQAQYEELNHTYEELQGTQTKLNYIAYHDPLTNLGNRASFLKYFDTTVKNKNDGYGSIAIIDIDNFKHINDTLGHVFGDKLIHEVGMKIQSLIKYPFEVFRIGGDEFVLTLPYCNHNETQKITDNILTNFNAPIIIDEHSINVTISIGVSFYPMHGKTTNELLSRADVAMYRSKDTGKNKVTFFSEEMLEKMNKRREIEKNLEKAIMSDELMVYFQPQMDAKKGKVWGFEALIRWNSPNLGYVPPLEFISLAEENQLIIPIGHFVLEKSCEFIKSINEETNEEYKISINASPVEIVQGDFVRRILRTLDSYKLPYNILEVEVTESIMVESFDIVNEKLCHLKSKGIGVALDDFGTGYSSLSYLQKLPISTLKIDKSFIDDIPEDEIIGNLVKSIIDIGKELKMDVVIEGVESEKQKEFLIRNGSDRIQGYYYSKPIPEKDVRTFLHKLNME